MGGAPGPLRGPGRSFRRAAIWRLPSRRWGPRSSLPVSHHPGIARSLGSPSQTAFGRENGVDAPSSLRPLSGSAHPWARAASCRLRKPHSPSYSSGLRPQFLRPPVGPLFLYQQRRRVRERLRRRGGPPLFLRSLSSWGIRPHIWRASLRASRSLARPRALPCARSLSPAERVRCTNNISTSSGAPPLQLTPRSFLKKSAAKNFWKGPTPTRPVCHGRLGRDPAAVRSRATRSHIGRPFPKPLSTLRAAHDTGTH